ncbi:MAG: glycosyltransferase family 39 protein [Candidatus Nanoarchaeia archaeon]|nr:glycosyltransferase family 39 protein [Candidatus Nanoarchaeia archaeon]
MKINKIYPILVLAFALQLIFLFKEHAMWWDSSVYLGMGHYIYSLGEAGIWEHIRPLVFPLMLGFFWKLGLNDIFIGYLLGMAFSIGSILLAYLIGKKLFSEEAGEIAALMLALTPVFLESTFRIMTEIPSVFFALLALYFYIEKKPFASGIFAGIAFLTKFPQALVIAIIGIAFMRKWKNAGKFALGALCFIVPYLVFNWFMYGNPSVFADADAIIKNSGAWLFSGPVYYYLQGILKQNPLYILSAVGIYACVRERKYIIPALAIAFFAYFTYHVHKEIRFMLLMLPYFAILASAGIKKMFKQRWIFWAVFVIASISFASQLPEEPVLGEAHDGYMKFLEEKEITGEVLVAYPQINLYSQKAVTPMYYMVFNAELAQKWIDYLNNPNNVQYALVDNCSLVCHPQNDLKCEEKREGLMSLLKNKFSTAYNEKDNSCEYWVFERK